MDTSPAPIIFGKMADIMAQIEAIGKDQNNKTQGFKYRGIDDVYNAVNPLLAQHRIFMTSHIIEKTRDERESKNGGVLAFTCLRMQYTFWAEDGSSVSTEVEGEGMDSGDKSSNKAMSVAHKYALLQAFCIPTKDMDDPDAETHEVKGRAKPANTQAPAATNKPRQETPFDEPEPAYVKDAKSILAAAHKVAPDEWDAFMDGIRPRLDDIKAANAKTYAYVTGQIDKIESTLGIAA